MVVGVGGLRNVGARKSEGRGEEALINGRYGVLRTTGKRNSSQEFTTRPWNIHRGCFLPLLGYESSIGGPAVRTRRVPSERLRLVSKSHLTLTWGGVMKQHDLRFAAPCSCLIETSVAHPPILERESILAWSSRQGVRTPHRAARACATRIYTRVYILRVTIIVLERETRYCATVESRLRGSRPIAFHAGEEISLSLSLSLTLSFARARSNVFCELVLSAGGREVADRMDGVGTQGAMNYAAVPDIPVNFAVNRFGKFLSRHVSGQVIRSVFAETIFFGCLFLFSSLFPFFFSFLFLFFFFFIPR